MRKDSLKSARIALVISSISMLIAAVNLLINVVNKLPTIWTAYALQFCTITIFLVINFSLSKKRAQEKEAEDHSIHKTGS